jgi:hypothetical protein
MQAGLLDRMTQRVRELEVTMCLAGLRPWSLGSLHVRSDVRDLCKSRQEVISYMRTPEIWKQVEQTRGEDLNVYYSIPT